jgi:hypothetical protein
MHLNTETEKQECVISGFRRKVAEICALLRYYAALTGNSLPTFRENLPIPSSRVKNPNFLALEDECLICG